MPQSASPAPAFKAFIDFKFVRENLGLVGKNCVARKVNVNCVAVVKLYDDFVAMKMECDEIRQKRNDNSKAMKVRLDPENCWGMPLVRSVLVRSYQV